jgi:DNA-binding PadR family transcriptional regulator
MKPFKLFLHQKKSNMSARKDVILDVIGAQSTVIDLVDFCFTMGVASQATIHREIHEMIDAGFISSRVPPRDKRLVILRVTKKGRDYLSKL